MRRGAGASWSKTLAGEKEPPDRAKQQQRAAANVSTTSEEDGSRYRPGAQDASSTRNARTANAISRLAAVETGLTPRGGSNA
jgi:hypothetical protein